EAGVVEGFRVLVHEKKPAGFPFRPGAFEIFRPYCMKALGQERREKPRKRRRATALRLFPQPVDDEIQVVKFSCTFDHRMRGKDFLYKRRTGARHAEYKDRTALRRACTAPCAEESGREHGLELPDEGVKLRGGAVDAGRLQCLTFRVVLESLPVTLRILQRLGERKVQLHPR